MWKRKRRTRKPIFIGVGITILCIIPLILVYVLPKEDETGSGPPPSSLVTANRIANTHGKSPTTTTAPGRTSDLDRADEAYRKAHAVHDQFGGSTGASGTLSSGPRTQGNSK